MIGFHIHVLDFCSRCCISLSTKVSIDNALYPLGPVATLRFCHLRPRCVSKQRRTTNVIISDRVWWIWCDAGLAAVATRPQRSPHSVASNSRPDYFAATRSRSLFLSINECCVSAAAAAIWEIQWRRTYAAAGPSGYRGLLKDCKGDDTHHFRMKMVVLLLKRNCLQQPVQYYILQHIPSS